jgi:uncharacterized protein YbaP (TraB family)
MVISMHKSVLSTMQFVLCSVFLCVSVVSAADTRRDHGLLWEISKPGMAASYLFGTVHSEDPEVVQLAPPVQQAFDRSGSVILEIMMDMNAMIYSSTAMLMTDDRTLSEVVGESLYKKTALAIQSRGIPELVLERMKPWAAATILSVPPPETGLMLDLVLYQQAQAAGKQLHGLETIQEQLGIFDSMSENDQIQLLRDAVDNLDKIDRMNAEVLVLYKRRDLAGMQALNQRYMNDGDPGISRDLEQRLIIDRNRTMVERMQPYLQAGNAFVAVGALHLPGDQGLLGLLDRRGYTVKRVY